jgi:Xaa-Pro aminopeptidase
MHLNRRQRLQYLMKQEHIDALLITSTTNRTYLTGFTGSSGYLLLTADQCFLLIDSRYMIQAAQQVQEIEVIEHLPQVTVSIRALLQKLGISKLAFEQTELTYQTFLDFRTQLQSISFDPILPLVNQLRIIKDDHEIAIMKEAAKLADEAFHFICSKLLPGMTEREIALELEIFIRKHGGTSTSFDTIVASGERSALPHGVASDRVLQKNEFVKLDFGAYYKGYCSDLTRTVMLGQPTSKHQEIYEIVLEAQMNVLQHLKPGITGAEADALARDIINHYGYGDYFGHGTGHGLGMQIHESPRLSKQDNTILTPGMVVTVEPGIYLPGFGGVRIEDDIVLTDTGIKILTQSSKQFMIID